MNAFNRVAMAALAALLLAVSCASLLLLAGVLEPGTIFTPDGPLAGLQTWMDELDGGPRIAAYLVVSGALALAAVLFFLELFATGRRRKPFVVSSTELGTVAVERRSVCRLGDKVAGGVEGVLAARCAVSDKADGVRFVCRLTLSFDAAVEQVSEEVRKSVREAVERQVGLSVSAVDVRVRIGEEPPPPPPRTVN